jgi:hypothetical protein
MPKAKSRSNPGRKAKEGQPLWKRFFGFIASPVGRRLILIVVIVILLYVLWEGMLRLFGYGLIIIAMALGMLIWVAWRRQFSIFRNRWNWILGGISLAFAVWGILSFSALGGTFGQGIIGASNVAGGFRVAGLVLLGVIFIIPQKSWSAAKKSWSLLTGIFRRPSRLVLPPQAPSEVTSLEATSAEAGKIDEVEAKPAVLPSPPVWQSEHEPILTPGGWQQILTSGLD